MTTRPVSVFRSNKEEGLYLYVDSHDGLSRVPEDLQKRFGCAELAMTIELTPHKKLARADAGKVLQAIASHGFYLQLPPGSDAYMLDIRANNHKL